MSERLVAQLGIDDFEPKFDPGGVEDLRERLARLRWEPSPGLGWELGGDLEYLAALCAHWASDYDFGRVARELGGLDNGRCAGLHFAHGRAVESGPQARLPVLLIHGWPGAAIEFTEVAALLNAAGHDVVIPSLPGFGFSERPDRPLNVAANATALRELMAALGYERYAVQGGDWGSVIGARLAFDVPRAVAALHVNTPGVLPVAGES